MGLDQSLYKRKDSTISEIAYWRKHSNLQGFLENDFGCDLNCEEVVLSKELILRIALYSAAGEMPEASGFFWGKSDRNDDFYTVKVMMEALDLIKEGYEIVYSCSY